MWHCDKRLKYYQNCSSLSWHRQRHGFVGGKREVVSPVLIKKAFDKVYGGSNIVGYINEANGKYYGGIKAKAIATLNRLVYQLNRE